MAYTRAQFRSRIRSRLGWPAADTFAGDTELNDYVNDSLAELHSLLVNLHKPGSWGVATTTDVVSSGSPAISLPSDFGRIINVALIRGTKTYPMTPYDAVLSSLDFGAHSWTQGNVAYNVAGDVTGWSITFIPTIPAASETVLTNYIKGPPVLSADGDMSWMGDDEYVVLDVMIKCREKEEADVSTLVAQKAQYEERMKRQAAPIDMGQPRTVQDARSIEDSYSTMRDPTQNWWIR